MPTSTKTTLKELAGQLLAYEATSGNSAGAEDPMFRVCEKLRGPLSKLTGVGGFRSLLSRALALAGGEVRWLRALHIRADGSLESLDELAKLDSRAIAEGELALVTQLLGLLMTFIGPGLTLRLLHDVWPKMDDQIFQEEIR